MLVGLCILQILYSDNRLGDTMALMGEGVCQICQTEGDMQCHSNDRYHPAYVN